MQDIFMKEIKLNKGSNGLVALVDDDVFEKIGHFNWYAEYVGHTIYAMRYFYNQEKNKKDHKRMHREILGTTDTKIVTDHIDRNGLNNQRSNLRACTQAQNVRNTKFRKCNSTGYKGVSPFSGKVWKNQINPIFRARIIFNGKEINIGYFRTAKEAAIARDLKAVELHGEFAFLNFPELIKKS